MRLRDTRYTGANRCWPCTALNGAVLALAVGGLFLAGQPAVAVAALLVGVAVISLKGYLVPGTPTLGRRMPASVRRRFGKTDPAVSTEPTTALVRAGVLTDDLTLPSAHGDRVQTEARRFVEDRDGLERAAIDRFPTVTEVSVNRGLGGGETWLALDDDEVTVHQWDARPVAALNVSAAALLADHPVGWHDRSARARAHLLTLLRYAVDRCPDCGEPFSEPTGPTVVCCGGRSLVGERRCEPCGYPLVDRNDLPTTNGASPATDAADQSVTDATDDDVGDVHDAREATATNEPGDPWGVGR